LCAEYTISRDHCKPTEVHYANEVYKDGDMRRITVNIHPSKIFVMYCVRQCLKWVI